MAKNKLDSMKRLIKPDRTSLTVRRKKIDRNDPCPCGSGKKFKKCCYQGEVGFFTRLSRILMKKK